jgi:hypothetical protein
MALGMALGGCSEGAIGPSTPSDGGAGGAGASGGFGGVELLGGSDCDPMVPSHCGFPFPSNVYLVNDATTASGKRVAFGAGSLPLHEGSGTRVDPAWFSDSDGFSAGQAPMTHLPGATVTGLPSVDDIGLSLSKESPTVLLEADTGIAVPHFAELDMTSADPDDRAFMLRPVVRLRDGTRYIVALRRVVDDQGRFLEPTPVFRALRDGSHHDDPSVAARRALYYDILSRLHEASYDTRDLLLAWDFTTASRANNTRALLHMRDHALAAVGAEGPSYTVEQVEEDPNEHIKRRLHLKMRVPLYLDSAEPGGKLNRGADGLPAQNGEAEFDVLVHVPHSATTRPAALLQNGHGLLGRRTEGQNGYLARIANEKHYVAFSVNLVGMDESDENSILAALTSDIGLFKHVVERQHQGMVNSLLAMRLMKGRFVDEPQIQFDGHSAIDPSESYYRGDSQGGIFGGTYMALTTDVARGLLGEPGMPYNLLLNRSVDFEPFFVILKSMFESHLDVQIVLGLVQMLWDRTEPSGYVPYIADDVLPDTPSHEVLIHVAIGDYQVTPLGAHIMARTVGAKTLHPANRMLWNIEPATAAFSGNGIVEFRFPTVPEEPKVNLPPSGPEDNDPHDWVRELDAAIDQSDVFLRQGVVAPACESVCDPE